MILTCPQCTTRYLVNAANIGPGGRTVRCGRCSHSWREPPPPNAPPFADFNPVSIEARPLPPGSNLPVPTTRPRKRAGVGWLVLVVVIAVIVAGGIIGRGRIMALWPASTRVYAAIGMATEPLGSGLDLRNVSSKREMDGDVPVLVVAGQVANVSARPKDVPPLQGTLHDAQNRDVRSWNFPVNDAHLEPGAVTSFETRVRNPPAEATGLDITFASP
jgi:predicted Zn finger-like uncharacterized protein